MNPYKLYLLLLSAWNLVSAPSVVHTHQYTKMPLIPYKHTTGSMPYYYGDIILCH